MSVDLLVPILFNGMSLSAIYILVALGFTLVFGIMRVVNFAHGEFAMMGGFWLLFLLTSLHLSYWVVLPLAAVLVGVSSLLPGHQPLWRVLSPGAYRQTTVTRTGYEVLKLIPRDASVAAQAVGGA